MSRSGWVNLALLLAVVALFVVPLALVPDTGSEFGGTDTRATEVITEQNPTYEPWFSAIFAPPSSSIESALFAVQAALGAGLLGYYFGVARTRKRLAPEGADKPGRDG